MSGSMPDFGNQKVNTTQSLCSRVYSLVGVIVVQISARADSDKGDKVGAEKWGSSVLAGRHQGVLPGGAGICTRS